MDAGADPLWGCKFVRTVAHTGTTWNKEHGDGREARHEKRVVIRSADHFFVRLAGRPRRVLKGAEDARIACCRRICVYQFGRNGDGSAAGDRVAGCVQAFEDSIASGAVDVTDIGLQPNPRWDAVDRARKDVAHADRGHGVDRPARPGRSLKREDQFRRSGQGVLAARHQFSPGVAALAFDQDTHARWRRDVRYQPKVEALLFEMRSLLDVQFNEMTEAASSEGNRFERTRKPGICAQFVQALALPVA